MHYLISSYSLSCWVMVFPQSLEFDVGDRHTDREEQCDSVIKLHPRWSPVEGSWISQEVGVEGLCGGGVNWMKGGECSQGVCVCVCVCVSVSDAGEPGQRQAWISGMGNWQYHSEEMDGSHILYRKKEGWVTTLAMCRPSWGDIVLFGKIAKSHL